MSEPTSAMTEAVAPDDDPAPDPGPPPGTSPPPEPGWKRLVVPGLAVVAILVALAAFVAWRQLNPATQEYTGQRIDLVPEQDAPSPFQGFAIQPERPAPAFELTDQHGEPWRLADQKGTVTALFFGYTHCPDICPQTMQRLAEAVSLLGPDAAGVQVALITVDPERDTPEVLGTYVANFNPDFVGLYGQAEEIQAIAKGYGVDYIKELPPAMATQAAMLAGHDTGGNDTGGHEEGGHDADAGGDTGSMGAMADTAPMTDTMNVAGDDHDAGMGVEMSNHDMPASVLTPGTDAYTVAHSGVVFLIDRFGQLRSSFLGPFTPEEVVHDVRLLLGAATTGAGG